MQERGICKELGCRWIVIDYNIYYFDVGDIFYFEVKEIYVVMYSMVENLKVEGCIFDIRFVQCNIDEEDKEGFFCFSFEKIVVCGFLEINLGI